MDSAAIMPLILFVHLSTVEDLRWLVIMLLGTVIQPYGNFWHAGERWSTPYSNFHRPPAARTLSDTTLDISSIKSFGGSEPLLTRVPLVYW